MYYGYCRVSTREQNEERQLVALREFIRKEGEADKITIYTDKQSGKDFNRTNYQKLIRRLKQGDVLVVKSIDRLGRNYTDIQEEWRKINKAKGCDIVVLDMPLLDTRNSKDLTGVLISDIVLQLLSYVAESERNMIRSRQAEGIAIAKANGVKFGRPAMPKPANYEEVVALYNENKLSARKAARLLGTSHITFLKWVREDVRGEA